MSALTADLGEADLASCAAGHVAPDEIGERLARQYRRIYETSMRDVPIVNPVLHIEAIGFRPFGALMIGIVITPWFMNLVALPVAENPTFAEADGAACQIAFPIGEIDFIAGTLSGFGRLFSASLFSPMFDFKNMDVARETAEQVMRALFAQSPSEEGTTERRHELDRRALLRGRIAGKRARP